MQKWELKTHVVYLYSKTYGSYDIEALVSDRDPETKKTVSETLNDFTAHGWEPVSVTPLQLYGSGVTSHLLYTFKRQKQ